MPHPDIRWKQRFPNYEKALSLLSSALQLTDPDILQKAGIIQFFEMSYELVWNTLKDYLEEQGFTDVKSPGMLSRKHLKRAFSLSGIHIPDFFCVE